MKPLPRHIQDLLHAPQLPIDNASKDNIGNTDRER